MSGPIPTNIAAAAGRLAEDARHAAAGAKLADDAQREGLTVGRLVQRRALARISTRSAESLPGAAWREMALRTRTVLVMLAGETDGDPREVARRPWEALADSDRASIAACARTLHRDLAGAACLF